MAFFRQPLERWLLRIDPSLPSPGPPVPAGFSRIESHPDWSRGLTHLAAMGLEKLAVLGGARLASALVQEDLVDELQLTVCPLLLGGGHSWLPPEVAVASDQQGAWTLVEHRCLGGDELLLRYGRTDSRTDGRGALGS
jgi:5-amino-6-(5-phosphoribosylamino)uracil reductase